MPSSGAYTVKIKVDGVDLEEYDVEQKGNVSSCWIASEAGKNFSVQWSGAASDASLSTSCLVDGNCIPDKVYQQGSGAFNYNSRGGYISEDTLRLFAFSQVSLTDDESIASPDQNLSNLGTIEIQIYRVEVLGKSREPTFVELSHAYDSPIHERSKKLAMHRVSLKEIKRDEKPATFLTTRRLEDDPHTRFVFNYRPKEFLLSQGIIPGLEDETGNGETLSILNSLDPKGKKRKRAGCSTGQENDSDDNAKRRAILNEKEKQLQELQAEIEQLKQGGGCVKREVKIEPLAFVVDANGVIDLTG